MEDNTTGTREQNATKLTSSMNIYHQKVHGREEHKHLSLRAGRILDRADTFIYALVGACFLFGAILALGYTFWDFGVQVLIVIPQNEIDKQPGVAAGAIIQFISGLLLVLIIMEVLGTVIHYLKSHETSLRPFLFIGIVSATRSILSIGARLSVGAGAQGVEFTHAMIELGVSAAVILALGITLKLLGKLVADDSTKD
jgi:uncharacterized membrane protein (DUF373 family)